MFYPELLKIIEKTGAKEAIEKLDKYFAFLPNKNENIITVSSITTVLGLDYDIVESILQKIEDMGILKKQYIILCPECSREIFYTDNREELIRKVEEINTFNNCIKCNNDIFIEIDDIYVGYKLIKETNIDQKDIQEELEKINFGTKKDSDLESLKKLIENNKENPHDFFYNPSEEELEFLRQQFKKLNGPFENNTSKGAALEGLVKSLFELCRGLKPTTKVHTKTNQIDCTVRNDYFLKLTVYEEFGSIIKAECKNEPAKKPGNDYYNKLIQIVRNSKYTYERSVGILFSRLPIKSTCKQLAREAFIKDEIVIINFTDSDFIDILYNNINFLDLLQEKIQEVKLNITTNGRVHKLYRK